MLDIQFIRDNAELVKQKSKQKGYDVDIDLLIRLTDEIKQQTIVLESARQKSNELAALAKGQKPSQEQIDQGRKQREIVSGLEKKIDDLKNHVQGDQLTYNQLLRSVPNIFPDDTPIGDESANQEEKKWGNQSEDPKLKDHLTWAEEHGLLDFERGAKVAGNKFYFTLGSLVQLEQAVFQMALQKASQNGFVPITVPHMVNTRTIEGTGFLAKGDEEQIYKIEDEDLHLIATSEIPITGFYADEILDLSNKPILYAGISPAYRREAGAYGKHSKGLYRVHQFNKLELYVFCKPDQSEQWHQKLIAIEEEICQDLQIPYRLVRIASGDLGAPAYKKFDIEYYSPAEKTYRELMSCSNVTDYQARRLNIRFRNEQGTIQYVHTLNGTAAAFSRTCIAIIENLQQPDGKVLVPEALRPYMGGQASIS